MLDGMSAVLAILQTSIDVADRVKYAKDKKGLTMVINQKQKEVTSLKEIVVIVNEEKALQIKTIITEFAEIGELATKLEDLLKMIGDAGFVGKFVHGKDQKEVLGTLTADIVKAKSNLNIKIQSAHVGLTVPADRKFVVQTKILESVETSLKRQIDDLEGLSIWEIVKGREPSGIYAMIAFVLDRDWHGVLQPMAPSPSTNRTLGLQAENGTPYRDGSRVIDKNMAYDQSIMIRGTVGTEGFIEPKHIRILNNVSRDQATMICAFISEKAYQEARQDRLEIIRTMVAQGTLGAKQISEMLQEDSDRKKNDRTREGRAERSQD